MCIYVRNVGSFYTKYINIDEEIPIFLYKKSFTKCPLEMVHTSLKKDILKKINHAALFVF